MRKVMNFLMCASMFMDDFYFFREPFDFYYFYIIYFVFILYYIITMRSMRLLPKWYIKFLFWLFGLSMLAGVLYNTLGFSFVKQIIGITYSSAAFYCLLRSNKFDIEKIFKIYLRLAFLVSLWGIIVELFLLSGIAITDKIKQTSMGLFRAYSIMSEPYFLAVVLIPALWYLGYTLVFDKQNRNIIGLFRFSVIFVCFILTFSSAGFIALGLMFIMALYNLNFFSVSKGKGKFLLLPLAVILLTAVLGNLKEVLWEFQVRIDDTVNLFRGGKPDLKKISEVNSSTFALYTNYIIAQESFVRNPLLGSGIGSHPVNYDEFFGRYFPKDFIVRFGTFNKFDANSLFLRLMSETGLFGLVSFFFFLFRFYMKKRGLKNPQFHNLNLINQGIFILLIVRLIRTGNYIGNGFFLFFFMYYFTRQMLDGKVPLPGQETGKTPPSKPIAAVSSAA